MDAYELIERGEREIADGSGSPRKTLERARRDLLAKRDVDGLERLLGVAQRLDDGGDLPYAIRQNLRSLDREGEVGAGSGPPPAPAAPVPAAAPRAGRARSFPFGDARRPRSLALALVTCIALFPVLWGVLLIGYWLGGGNNDPNYPRQSTQNDERVLIWMAAVLPAIGLVAAVLDWLHARRSYPPEERGELLGWEGILSLAGVLVVLVAAVALGLKLWNTVI